MTNSTSDEREPTIKSGGESLSIFEVMQRYRNDGSCEHVIQDALQRLSLLDSEVAEGGPSPSSPVDHDSCSHWREGDSNNCVLCGDDLGPTSEADVSTPYSPVPAEQFCKCGLPKDDPIHSFSTEWQQMHKFMPAATPTPVSLEAREAAEEIREWIGISGMVDGEGLNEVAAIIERHCSPVPAAGGDEDQRPSCWHCGDVLEATELKLRCDQCPADCDDETCSAFGCAPR